MLEFTMEIYLKQKWERNKTSHHVDRGRHVNVKPNTRKVKANVGVYEKSCTGNLCIATFLETNIQSS